MDNTEVDNMSKEDKQAAEHMFEPCDTFTIEEIEALHRYVVQEGLMPTNTKRNFNGSTQDVESEATESPSSPIGDEFQTMKREARLKLDALYASDAKTKNEVHDYYNALCNVASPVTGKTLIDSVGMWKNQKAFFIVGVFIIVLSLSNQVSVGVCSENELGFWCDYIQPYFLEIIEPFLWGALGGYIYLLQRMFMLASKFRFNSNRFTGWIPRLILGGFLGGVVQYTVDRSFLTESGYETVVVAFFVGIAAKPIYDVYEDAAFTFSMFLREKMVGDKSKASTSTDKYKVDKT